MADYTETYKDITEKLRNTIHVEFRNALPCVIGFDGDFSGSQFVMIEPVGSVLLEYIASAETREYEINIKLFTTVKIEKDLHNMMNIVNRIEALFHDNIRMVVTEGNFFNCRTEATVFNESPNENYMVTSIVWKGIYTGNQS